MTGEIKCKTKGEKCPQCNWQSPVLYRLEGEWMCANCVCEAIVEKGYSIVPEGTVEHSLLRIAGALEHMCMAGIGVQK